MLPDEFTPDPADRRVTAAFLSESPDAGAGAATGAPSGRKRRPRADGAPCGREEFSQQDGKNNSTRFEITRRQGPADWTRPARASWREAGIADHFVQFYRDDSHLVREVAGFMEAGLRSVEGAIVIASEAHRRAIEDRLEVVGVDVAAARARRQYVPLDAEETLARFMVNGSPDEVLFMHVVGGIVTRMASAGFRVRAFGEIVAILWSRGETEAALQLEHLWNKLSQTRRFALYCAYPSAHFAREKDLAGYRHVCAAHKAIIPSEGPLTGSSVPVCAS